MTVGQLRKALEGFDDNRELFVSVVVTRDIDGDWRQHQELLEVSTNQIPLHSPVCLLAGYPATNR